MTKIFQQPVTQHLRFVNVPPAKHLGIWMKLLLVSEFLFFVFVGLMVFYPDSFLVSLVFKKMPLQPEQLKLLRPSLTPIP